MEYDEDKVDEMVLALLFLTLRASYRAWKGHDWSAVDGLHKKGMIANPWKSQVCCAHRGETATFTRTVTKHFTKSA